MLHVLNIPHIGLILNNYMRVFYGWMNLLVKPEDLAYVQEILVIFQKYVE
jgi:hypothetical protein